VSRGSIRNESILHTIMSIVDVKVPQLSESVAEATLLQWKKQAGQAVAADEVLIEIETDKVVLEVPAPGEGVLIELVVASGGTVSSDQLIARIDTQATADVTVLPVAPSPKAASTAPAAAPAPTKAAVAMPAAAKLMADHQLAAGAVAGSGKDGRVTKGDVLAAVAASSAAARPAPSDLVAAQAQAKPLPAVAAPVSVHLGDRPQQRVPMSRLRDRR
jgi:2-oxoglutarate dehydrogenase E2 component (dihydrolipoamide succinyltransferase)